MSGTKIIDVKIVDVCSKHRTKDDLIPKDKHGKPYTDEELTCVECSFKKEKND